MRDPKVEQYLDRFELHYEFLSVPVDRLNLTASLKNNARTVAKLPDTIERYRVAMEEADDFPGIVITAMEGEQYFILSGVQRSYAAVAAHRKTLDAYLVEPVDPVIAELIARSANVLEGQGSSTETALESAIYMVQHCKYSQKSAARQFGFTPGALSREINLRETHVRLTQAGVDTSQMKRDTVHRLHPIQNDRVLGATAALINRAQLNSTMSDSLVAEVNRERTEDRQLAVVADWAGREDVRKRVIHGQAGTQPLPRTMGLPSQLRASMNRLHTLVCTNNHISQTALTEQEIEECTKLWEDLSRTGSRFFARTDHVHWVPAAADAAPAGREAALAR